MGSQEYGIAPDAALKVALPIKQLAEAGHEVGIVIGGGNVFRGGQLGSTLGLKRTPADQIGMLATLMNGIVLEQALLGCGCDVRMFSALECPRVAQTYQWEKVMRQFSKGRIVLFVGGTGHPFFTTDTTAALRASEIGADIFLKATMRVDGVYNKDPRVHNDAVKYKQISYQAYLEQQLKVIDLTAVTLCMLNQIPIRVFNFFGETILDAVSNRQCGTLVGE